MNSVRLLFGFLVTAIVIIAVEPKSFFHVSFQGFLNRFGNKESPARSELKQYSGKRSYNESIRTVYYHDQTVAVIELGKNKLLLNCEFIEIDKPEQVSKVLGETLKNSDVINVSFDEMLKLMSQCWQLESHYLNNSRVENNSDRESQLFYKSLLPSNPLALFSGIIPGTKWCGTGDIAVSYFDLGSELSTDRCCRAHDLCPVKVRAYTSRYNLTNDSLYTKSHCDCDDILFKCLKDAESPSSSLLGNIYFNLVQVPCVGGFESGKQEFSYVRRSF